MKKTIRLFLLVIFATTMTFSSVLAQEEEDSNDTIPLYRYVNDGSPNLGLDNFYYDESDPMPFYKGSNEYVTIAREYQQEKEQFKATWIATTVNLHFGQYNTLNEVLDAFSSRLNTLEDYNMNAVIFQVRPELDAAYYESEINPTSRFASGNQGEKLDFDPMPNMINMAHEKGMEFHAWFNPYRVNSTGYSAIVKDSKYEGMDLTTVEKIEALVDLGYLSEDNYAALNPEHVLYFNNALILNPGEPEVVQHMVDTIEEFVTKYDVDAIHFDDYFYPYKTSDEFGNDVYFGEKGEDDHTFAAYGGNQTDIQQWRRDNVTSLVRDVAHIIDKHNAQNKTAVQFGISPFGIWKHLETSDDGLGSNTPIGSTQSYTDQIYADTYTWIKEELVDYVLPQVYWTFDTAAAPYAEITRFWNEAAEGTDVDVYIGHPMYKINSWYSTDDWYNPEEINNQLKFNQLYKNIKGSALYGYTNILRPENPNASLRARVLDKTIDILQSASFSTQSLTPSRPSMSHEDTKPLTKVIIKDGFLYWEDTINDNARFYVVYGAEKTSIRNMNDLTNSAYNIIEKGSFKGKGSYSVELPENYKNMTFAVTLIDKAMVETAPTLATYELPESTLVLTKDSYDIFVNDEINETKFIDILEYESSVPITTITSNFNSVVDLTTPGTYEIIVSFYYADYDTTIDKIITLNVIENKNENNPEDNEFNDSNKKPQEDTTNKDDSNDKNEEDKISEESNLPKTGVSYQNIYIGMGLLVSGCFLYIFKFFKKR